MITRILPKLIFISWSFSTSISAVSDQSWIGPEFSVIQKIYDGCQDKDDFIGCLKQKALYALSKAMDQNAITVVDGFSFEKHNTTIKESIISAITDGQTLNTLPVLDRSLLEKLDQFLRTHIIKIDMNEGRGKKSGKYLQKLIIVALFTALGIAGPIGLKVLGAIAIKALVISKIALAIAGIIALKKLLSHNHHEETNFEVHADSSDHNRRNAFILRPLKAGPEINDPYRYYYQRFSRKFS